MADLVVEGDEVVLRLSAVEHAESAHRDVRVPRSAIRGVDVLDDPAHAVPGLKLVGSSWPGEFAVGLFQGGGRRCFAVVHRGAGGVRVRLEGARYDELVVSCGDPRAVAASLEPPGDGLRYD